MGIGLREMAAMGLAMGVLSWEGQARTFCANDSADLQQILNTADSNGENDEVRIHRGTYVAPPGGFVYNGEENFSIEISGGWSGLLGGCDFAGRREAFETTLDGGLQERVLLIDAGLNSDITISRISFANGSASLGAGLLISDSAADPYSGDVVLERNAFINNTASSTGSAFFMSGGDQVRLRNNLFTINDGPNVIDIDQVDGTGVYLTNNTVTANTATVGNAAARLRIVGTSQLFVANNILWNNTGRDLTINGVNYFLRNNNIGQANINVGATGVDNLNVDPMFVPGLFSYDLRPQSGLIDAGTLPPRVSIIPIPFDDNWGEGLYDFSGADRILGPGIDIGAFEAPEPLPDFLFSDSFE